MRGVLKRLLSKYLTGWICTSLFCFWLSHGKCKHWSQEAFASVIFIYRDDTWPWAGHGMRGTNPQPTRRHAAQGCSHEWLIQQPSSMCLTVEEVRVVLSKTRGNPEESRNPCAGLAIFCLCRAATKSLGTALHPWPGLVWGSAEGPLLGVLDFSFNLFLSSISTP